MNLLKSSFCGKSVAGPKVEAGTDTGTGPEVETYQAKISSPKSTRPVVVPGVRLITIGFP